MIKSKVSVIVPVYNVEKYLDSCIKSIVEQTYKNLEIVIVDDKSTDKSGEMCDEWARKDRRIKVIHKHNNEGLNMARATGFQNSTGQYISFLDSDDIFSRNNIGKTLTVLLENDADVAVYAFSEFSDADEKKGLRVIETERRIRVLNNKDMIAKYAFFGDSNLPSTYYMTVHGKLYKRDIVTKVDWHVSNYRIYEDNFWTPQALLLAKKVVLISDALMFYRRNIAHGAVGVPLSNRLTGNSLNGKPIGYMELIEHMTNYEVELSDRHKIYGVKERLKEKCYREMFERMNRLIEADLLGQENNLQYVKDVWRWHRENDASIHSENTILITEMDAYLGIKRSAQLLLGNIKRRIKKSLRLGGSHQLF